MSLLLLPLGLGVVAVVVWLAIALLRIFGVMVVQWRDLLSTDRWREVFDTIRRSRLRTALTMISVAWGIFVLVFLLGLGKGIDNGLHHQFARDATNGIWITANKTSIAHDGYAVGRKITFDNRDYDRIQSTAQLGPGGRGIDHVSGQYYLRGDRYGGREVPTRRGGKVSPFQINAVHPDAIYLSAQIVEQGRFLDAVDIAQRRKSAVIGRAVRDFLFGGEDPVGQWINVVGVPFQVVGVFSGQTGAEQERQIYIPVSTAQLTFHGADRLGMLAFTIGDATPAEAKIITDRIVAQLAERHEFDVQDPQAIRIQNNVEQFDRFTKIFWLISTFVTVIGIGTLSAGVVGVSNIMMIAVRERTREIGVRKALGATPNAIIAMIVQEAVFLTGVAGLLGLAAGVALLGVAGDLIQNDFVKNPAINLEVGVATAAGLIVAGAVAGYFPARAAARINPIAALQDR
jgi:putative ABC transport system permease protein